MVSPLNVSYPKRSRVLGFIMVVETCFRWQHTLPKKS